jgi:hypothetical protein
MTQRRTIHIACLALISIAGAAAAQSIHGVLKNPFPVEERLDSQPIVDFDIRTGNPAIAGRIERVRGSQAQTRRLLAAGRLENSIAGARVDLDPLFGGPKFIRSTSTLLTPATNGRMTAPDVVRVFVADHAELFAITGAQIDAALVSRDSVSPGSGARTLWWTQRVNGLELFDTQLRGSVTGDGRLISVSSGMLAEPNGGWRIDAVTIDASEALRLAAGFAGANLTSAPAVLSVGDGVDRAHRFAQTAELANEPYSRLMLFPLTTDELRPAWRVVVGGAGADAISLVFVDAATGGLLWRHSLTTDVAEAATYNVYIDPVSMRPLDSPAPMAPAPATPDGTQGAPASRTSIGLAAIDLFASPDGWIPSGGTQTLGNNVDAHTDQNADNQPDLPRPTAGDRNFDFPADLSLSPTSYEDASVVQLFYVSNWFHDLTHALGFDETSANFQEDNFGRGGAGGDSVDAQAQDGGGTNNANFNADPADGGLGRMQMFIFPGPSPDRDGSFDAQVVVHELTHGLSTRLHGGLFTLESAGMGEGWSDFYSMAMLLDPAIDPNAPIASGGWLTFGLDPGYDDNYYFGIRRYPYSTDFSVNPLTFADIDPSTYGVDAPAPPRSPVSFLNPESSGSANEVHNMGEIWCSALMQCRADMMAKHGAIAGNQLILQLVTDGMKLSPSSPSLIQARDGILLADLALTGGANVCDLWAGFAIRGFGFSASSGDGASATGLTEAFDIPTGLFFDLPGGAPLAVNPGVNAVVGVEIMDSCGDPIDPATARVFTSLDGAPFVSAPISESSPGVFDAGLPVFGCGQELRWYVAADTTLGATYTLPADAPTGFFTLVAFTDELTVLDDDFELDNGWTAGAPGDTASSGVWARVNPNGTGAQPEDDDSADGTVCFITGNASPGAGAGTNDVDNGFTTLISPMLDCTGGEAYISYSRWYSNNLGASPNADEMPIEISNDDGANWVNVETVTENANAWVRRTIRVADYVAPTSQVRMRFIASDLGDGSLVEAGVDEVLVSVLECVGGLVGDLNGDGVVDTADLGILIAAFGSSDPIADINGDGTVDTADLGILIAAFGSML